MFSQLLFLNKLLSLLFFDVNVTTGLSGYGYLSTGYSLRVPVYGLRFTVVFCTCVYMLDVLFQRCVSLTECTQTNCPSPPPSTVHVAAFKAVTAWNSHG